MNGNAEVRRLKPTPTGAEYLAEFSLGETPPHLRASAQTAGDAATDQLVRWGKVQDDRRVAEQGEERERRIQLRVERLEEAEEAKRRHIQSHAEQIDLGARGTLRDFLAESDQPPRWRIDGLLQEGGNGLLVAKAKSGKSTLTANFIRSCVDGDVFLGRYPVTPGAGLVTLLDFELPRETLRGWLRSQNIRDLDRMEPIALKGRAGSFDIRRDGVRAAWADRLAGTDVLIVDAIAPLLAALGLAEATEAGNLLPALDALKVEAGISEVQVVHHMGHGAERARGDSRLEGWPDSIWELNIGKDGVTRYLSARGRDVDLPETALHFDPVSKRLGIGGGSRHDAAVEEALAEVVAALRTAGEPQSSVKVEMALTDSPHSRADVRAALDLGIARAVLKRQSGARGAHLYSVAPS